MLHLASSAIGQVPKVRFRLDLAISGCSTPARLQLLDRLSCVPFLNAHPRPTVARHDAGLRRPTVRDENE